MEILIKYLGVTPLNFSHTWNKYSYEIYSTSKLSLKNVMKMIDIFTSTAQTCDITEVEINKTTNLSYKFLYKCSVTIDSSD
jgi:hypothetical protein